MDHPIKIDYLTENPIKEYAKDIRKADSKEELLKILTVHMQYANDAMKVALAMSDKDFKEFKNDLPKVNRKMPDEWVERHTKKFGAVVLPAKLLVSGLVAEQFKVPWGSAFIRCEEENWPMLKF